MKVIGYIRVSDQKLKTDGDRRQDIERQREKISKFSESMGWGEVEFYRDDGISAYKDDYNSRPNFVKMLHEIRARRINRVIIEDLTRWSRRIEDGLKTVREATENGCTITSMAEGEVQVTLPEQWFRTALGFLMAEWASKSQSHKVSDGMDRRLSNPNAVCKSCSELQSKKVVHLGRHPKTCLCSDCKRKARSKVAYEKVKNKEARVG